MNGTIKVMFCEDDFVVGPYYRQQVLEAMLNFAAEYYLVDPFNQIKEVILKGFPDVEAHKGGNVELLYFTLYSECFTMSFEGAVEHIRKFWKWIFNDDPTLFTERVMEAARVFHEYGVADAATFASNYGHYFEAALDANLYAPNYACLQACIAAGFDLDKWTNYEDEGYALAWLGYYPAQEPPKQI